MITQPISTTNVPAFAASGSRVQPDGITYANGYVSPVELPAEHLNWFLSGLTANGVTEQAAINAIIEELDAVLSAANLISDGTPSSQVLSAVKILGGGQTYAPGATPFTMSGTNYRVFLVTTGAGAFEVDLVSAATMLGYGDFMVVKIDSGAGAVQVKPNGADVFQNAGNVSLYLGTQWKFVKFMAISAGNLVVTGGTLAPVQTFDANGSQLDLGRLHHFPLGSSADRRVAQSTDIPTSGNWSAALLVTGSGGGINGTGVGVPLGARAVRLKVRMTAVTNGAGDFDFQLFFSDNNSTTPNNASPHPCLEMIGNTSGVHSWNYTSEIDVPLNSLGKFYIYCGSASNVAVASSALWVAPVGYYMGD